MSAKPRSAKRRAAAPSPPPDAVVSTEPEHDGQIIAERVAETLKPYLRDPDEVAHVVTRIVRVTESYSGPTPHPEHLERIEAIAPGSAREIISMAVREQKARHKLEFLTVAYPYIGLLCGFLVACMSFTFAYLLGMAGHTEVAAAMVGVSALGVIGWFIRSRLTCTDAEPDRPAAKAADTRTVRRR